jgi:hypothetical protein
VGDDQVMLASTAAGLCNDMPVSLPLVAIDRVRISQRNLLVGRGIAATSSAFLHLSRSEATLLI